MNTGNYKVSIIDDDSDFAEALSFYLKKIGIANIHYANSIKEAKRTLSDIMPDLVLLDIDLGEKDSGIDLGIYIKEKMPTIRIIFFTNNYKEEYYEAAKRAEPSAFLDKQLSELKVRQAVELAFLHQPELANQSGARSEVYQLASEFMFIKIGTSFKKIYLKDIDYIVYEDRYSNLVIDNKLIPLNLPMRDLAKNLPANDFIQVHQSYIANINKITQISIVHSQVELDGKILPIGTSFKKSIQEKLNFLT